MHNPKALKFNISKKLSQLMKVIQLFEGQIADREFQIEALHQSIDPQINQILDAYRINIEKFNSQADSEQIEAKQKIEKLYSYKYQTLKDDANAYVTAANSNMGKYEEKVFDDLSELQKQIKAIMNSIGNKTMAIETYANNAKIEVEKKLSNIQETYKKELLAHDQESQKKMQTLEEQSKLKIQKIEEDHKNEMNAIRQSFNGKGGSNQSVVDKMRQLKVKTDQLRKNLSDMKNNIKQLIDSRKKNGIDDRSRLKEVSNESQNLIANHKQAIEKIKSEIEGFKDKHKNDIEMMNHSLESQEIQHEMDIQKAELKKRDTIKMLNDEYEEAQQLLKNTFDSYGDSVKDLMTKHQLELEKIADQHERAVKEGEILLSQKHRDIVAIQEQQAREYARASEQLDEAKKMHEKQIKSLGAEQANEINAENQKFDKISKSIQDDIDNLLAGGNNEMKKFKDILQSLRDEKEKIMNDYSLEVNEYDAEHERKVAEIQNSNKEEIEKLIKEKSDQVNARQVQYDQEYEKLKETLNAEYENQQKKYQEDFENKMKNLGETRNDKSQIDSKIKKYQMEYEKEESKLNSIQAPEIENNPMFQVFDRSIAELNNQKDDVRQIIEVQKKHLEDEWKTKFDQENDRHSLHVVRNSMGTEREQKRLALLQEIGDVKAQLKEEEARLNDIIHKLTKEHEMIMGKLNERLVESKNTDEIDSLKNDIENLKKQSETNKTNSTNSFENKCKMSQSHISEENEQYEKEMKQIKEKIAQTKTRFEAASKDIENKLNETAQSSEIAIASFSKQTEEKLKKAIQDHLLEMEGVKKQYENLKEELIKSNTMYQKKMTSKKAMNQSSIDEYNRSSQTDLEKRSKDWNEMRKFYDEKISVLTKKREEAIQQFEKRPPRQSELDIIEKLQVNLQTRTMQLKNALKELTEYRTMLVKQEKEYNSRFGKGPKVGILSTTKH